MLKCDECQQFTKAISHAMTALLKPT